MDRAAAFAMNVLGDIRQQREMRERTDDGDGLVDVDAVEHPGQLGAIDLRAPHAERFDTGPLDEVEHLLAVLFTHRVAENRAEQADVLPHRLGGLATHLGAPHRTDRRERDVGSFSHGSSIDGGAEARMTSVP